METALQLFTLESPSYLSDTLATVPQMKSYYKWWFCLQLLRSLNAQPKDGQTYPPPAPCLTAFSFHRTRQPLRTLIVLLSQMSIIHGIGIIRFARTSIMLSMSLPISSRVGWPRVRVKTLRPGRAGSNGPGQGRKSRPWTRVRVERPDPALTLTHTGSTRMIGKLPCVRSGPMSGPMSSPSGRS